MDIDNDNDWVILIGDNKEERDKLMRECWFQLYGDDITYEEFKRRVEAKPRAKTWMNFLWETSQYLSTASTIATYSQYITLRMRNIIYCNAKIGQ